MQLSVIIPVYNAHATLETCLESIVHQEGDFEIVLLNDGSKDDSLAICNRYARQYPFIKVIDKANEGVCATRNKGIELARGEWTMFIDQDDWIDPDTLKKLIPASEVEYDGIIAPHYRHSRNGQIEQQAIAHPGIYSPKAKEFALCFREFGFLGMGAPWSRIYRTSILKNPQIRFNPKVTFCEDISFNYLFWNHSRAIKMIDQPFYHYVNTFANTTAKFVGDQLIINNKYLQTIEDPFWTGDIATEDAINFLHEHRAFSILFGLYTIYRSAAKMPYKERVFWIERYYRFGEEMIGDPSRFYHLRWHRLLGHFLRKHQWGRADLLLNTMFSLERTVNSFRQ